VKVRPLRKTVCAEPPRESSRASLFSSRSTELLRHLGKCLATEGERVRARVQRERESFERWANGRAIDFDGYLLTS